MKEDEMFNIAKSWENYLYNLDEKERKEVFNDRDKYWTEFKKFEKIFFEEKLNN